MDEERKKKLELLKIQAKTNEQKQSLRKNVLLQECLEVLSSYSIVEDENEIEYIELLAKIGDGFSIVESGSKVCGVILDPVGLKLHHW